MTDGLEDARTIAKAKVGRVLKEKWTLERLLGVGGMAAVYAGTHRNKRRGAVKILRADLSADPSMRQRFLREGYLANSVGHRGAVEVYDDDVADDGSAFLVMELLEGETLEARKERKGGQLPPLEVLALMDQLLDTLMAAHGKGIVHRDLKPENLFLARGGVVKVLDFGIARLREGGGIPSATQTGNAMGTPAFMAPEQARGRWEDVDGRTDLWAVGASMFNLLSGEYVHGYGTVNEILARAITRPTPPILTANPALDPQLAAFVDKALSYDKSARFPDAHTMQTELRALYQRLVGGAAMRAIQPSFADEMAAGLVPHGAAYGAPSARETEAPASQSTTVRGGPSNATLTTGRGVSGTTSASFGTSRKKWLPRAAAGIVAALVGLVLYARSGSSTDAPSAAAAPSAMPPPISAAAVPTVIPTNPTAVDVGALPLLAAPPSATSAKAAGVAPGRTSVKSFVVARPAPPPVPKKAPAELFRKRQ